MLGVLVHIQQHLDRRPSLNELAGLACLSPFHFHHVFSGTVGESLGSHVRKRRPEQRAAFVRHIGPYDTVAAAWDRLLPVLGKEGWLGDAMRAFAEARKLAFAGPHHEIYLSDPRRVPPARLRTILREPVR